MAAPMAAPAKNHATLLVLSSDMWFCSPGFILSVERNPRYGKSMERPEDNLTSDPAEESAEELEVTESGEAVDPSHEMDLETVFEMVGTEAEMEAIAVQSLLQANG